MSSNEQEESFPQPSTRPKEQHRVSREGHHDPEVSSQILMVLSKMTKSIDTNSSLISSLLLKEDSSSN